MISEGMHITGRLSHNNHRVFDMSDQAVLSYKTARRQQAQRKGEGFQAEVTSTHLPQGLAAWSIQGDTFDSVTDILLCSQHKIMGAQPPQQGIYNKK